MGSDSVVLGASWISLVIFLPWIGSALQAFLPGGQTAKGKTSTGLAQVSALLLSLLASGLALFYVSRLGFSPDLQANEKIAWIDSFGIFYDVGVDGLSALPVVLIALIFPILIAAEWEQSLGRRGMHALFLLLQGALFGAVFAQDLFVQFLFWGLSALPVYFLIGIWGGERRERAAIHSAVAGAVSNAFFFAAILLAFYSQEPHSFSIRELAGGKLSGRQFEVFGLSLSVSHWVLGLFAMGLALRAPIWPLHGWFVRVAEEAPFSVLVAVSSAIVPVAISLLARLSFTLFPELMVEASRTLVVVGALNLLVGVFCTVSQRDLRLVFAYITLVEVGGMLLGMGSLSSAGWVGAVFQWLVSGLALAGFGLVAGLLANRTGYSEFVKADGDRGFGGLAVRAPGISAVAAIIFASLLGIPSTAGFVGKALVSVGGYSIHPLTVVIQGVTTLMMGYTLLTLYRLVFLGKAGSALGVFEEISLREKSYILPLLFALILFGIYPKPVIELIRPTLLTLLSTVSR